MLRAREPYRHGDVFHTPYVVRKCGLTFEADGEECSLCDGSFTNQFQIEMRLPNEQECLLFHIDCFWTAMEHGTNRISVELVDGIDRLPIADQKAFHKRLHQYNQKRLPNHIYNSSILREINQFVVPRDKLKVLIFANVSVLKGDGQPVFCTLCGMEGYCDFEIIANHQRNHVNCVLQLTGMFIGGIEAIRGFARLSEADKYKFRLIVTNRVARLGDSLTRPDVKLEETCASSYPILVLSVTNIYCWNKVPPCLKNSDKCAMCNVAWTHRATIVIHHGVACHSACVFKAAVNIFDVPEMMCEFDLLPVECQQRVRLEFAHASRCTLKYLWTFPPEASLEPDASLEPQAKKRREAVGDDEGDEGIEAIVLQNEAMNKLRDSYNQFEDSIIRAVLFHHHQPSDVTESHEELVERLVDITTFGPPDNCERCAGVVRFHPARRDYFCSGYRSAFTRCEASYKNPRRRQFLIPAHLRAAYQHLAFQQFPQREYYRDGGSSAEFEPRAPEIVATNFPVQELIGTLIGTPFQDLHYICQGATVPDTFRDADSVHVARDAAGARYSAYLTSVRHEHNQNTAVELMLLKSNTRTHYTLLKVVSRIGTSIRQLNVTETFLSRKAAVQRFKAIFYDETGNLWDDRHEFWKHADKMFYVETHYPDVESATDMHVSQSVKDLLRDLLPQSPLKFRPDTQTLVNMTIGSYPYVSAKLKTIALQEVAKLRELIESGLADRDDFVDVTNQLYSMIPTNVGGDRLPLLDSDDALARFAARFDETPPDRIFSADIPIYNGLSRELNCNVSALDRDSEEWNMVHDYFEKTRGATHLLDDELVDIFKIEPMNQRQRKIEFEGERMLLWHGTRRSCVTSILRQGLLVNPNNRGGRGTGLMFGNGVYFADAYSKSAMYSAREPGHDQYIFLADVALGKCFPSLESITEKTVLALTGTLGYHSIKGVGKNASAPEDHHDKFGHRVPTGHLVQNKHIAGTLQYNEYVVYDKDRIDLKYVLRLKMHSAHYY